jgi:tetratricopeptide (TPR) repeat protein
MKINRNPLPELSDDVFRLDHEFWKKYSARLCGDWIDYDTTVAQITNFVERTYIENNYRGYTGDHAFVRDDDAQKAFSKLRSSQAGMYYWRMSEAPPEYRQKTAHSQEALVRETEFAFKQAFAFCPYSPEAVFRYVNFLLQMARAEEMNGHTDRAVHYFDDAILVGETCQKLDPFNPQITDLINSVKNYRSSIADRQQAYSQAATQMQDMEAMAQTNPANVRNLVTLGGAYLQMQQTNRAVALFDHALARPELTLAEAQALAMAYAQLQDLAKLELALKKMVALAPDQPEPRCDLAALEAITGHSTEAVSDLKLALDLSAKRRAINPKAPDLVDTVRNDPRFGAIRNLPEFQKLIPPK